MSSSPSPQITLYDLPCRGSHRTCWSPNTWKARLVLNYKSLPYTTRWIEYPDIAPTFKSLGIEPNQKEGMEAYTVPMVAITITTTTTTTTTHSPSPSLSSTTPTTPTTTNTTTTTQYIMDSLTIASELESLFPTTTPPSSLHLSSPILPKVEALILQLRSALAPILMPRVPRHLLNPSSAEYFEATRAQRFGMPLSELETHPERSGEKAWDAAKKPFAEMAALLNNTNQEKKAGEEERKGPFFLGSTTPSFADFVWVGFLRFVERLLGESEDGFLRVLHMDEAFGKLYQAAGKWLDRDD